MPEVYMKRFILLSFSLLLSIELFAFNIKGKVVDAATGEELAGVTIVVKDSPKNYTITGLDGSFSIDIDNAGAVLIFNYIGYREKEIAHTSDEAELLIKMDADIEFLSSAVVTGEGRGRTEIAARNIEKNSVNVVNVMSAKAIQLSPDITVLTNLAYRYFTIDLVNGRIFNPDSLPYGTDVSALVLDMTFDSPSSVEITVLNKDDGSLLKTIDYLENEDDSIDFNNDVKMKVVAADGVTSQDYSIEVRVHRVQADSLVWATLGANTLPTLLDDPQEQKTLSFGGKAYCFTTDGAAYNLATSSASASEWNVAAFTPWGDTLSVSTLVASADTLFALCGAPDAEGNQQFGVSSRHL